MRKSWTTRWNPIAHTRPSISAAAKVWLQKLWIQSFPPCPRAPLKSLFPMWSPLKSLFLCWSASEVHLAENSGVWCAPPPASRLSADISALVICSIKMISTSFLDCQEARSWFSRIFISVQEAQWLISEFKADPSQPGSALGGLSPTLVVGCCTFTAQILINFGDFTKIYPFYSDVMVLNQNDMTVHHNAHCFSELHNHKGTWTWLNPCWKKCTALYQM